MIGKQLDIADVLSVSFDHSGKDRAALSVARHSHRGYEVIHIYYDEEATNLYNKLTNKKEINHE